MLHSQEELETMLKDALAQQASPISSGGGGDVNATTKSSAHLQVTINQIYDALTRKNKTSYPPRITQTVARFD